MKRVLSICCLALFATVSYAGSLSAGGSSANAVVDGDKPHVSSSTEDIFFTEWGSTTYSLTASPGGGFVFIPEETKISAGEPNGTNSAKKTISDTKTNPESFSLGLYGKMYKPGGSGGSPIDWSASIGTKFFYIKSNQDGGAKNIVVPHGTSVKYSAYQGTSLQNSNWTVTGFPAKEADEIRFNKSFWVSLWPWSAPNITDPVAGPYTISATAKYPATGSDNGTMKVVGVKKISGPNSKSSTRSETPTGTEKWQEREVIYAQPYSVFDLTLELDPSLTTEEYDKIKNSISWSKSGFSCTLTPNADDKKKAEFKATSTGTYTITASLGTSEKVILIKVVEPKIHKVSFSGNITINKDLGGSYSGVAWQDDDLNGTSDLSGVNADTSKKYQPVAYKSTDKISTQGIFKPNCLKIDKVGTSNPTINDFISDWDVKAAIQKFRFSPDYIFGGDWSNWSPGGAIIGKEQIKSSAQVGYEGAYKILWEAGYGEAGTSDSSLTTFSAGYSQHELYLTFNATTSSHETVFHVGCTNANGQTQANAIVSSIWNRFSGLSVSRKGSSSTLKYYGAGYNTGMIFTTQDLLSNGDGRCGSWANFMKDILIVQGISASPRGVIPSSSVDGFLVKNWTFVAHSANPPDNTFPYLVDLYGPAISGTYPGVGINGQGPNSRPQSIFSDHAVVEFGNNIYDPSYGVVYSANNFLINFKNNALDGFYIDVAPKIWATNDKSTSISLN